MAAGYGSSRGLTIFPMTAAAREFVMRGITQQPANVKPRIRERDVGQVIVERFPQTEPMVLLEGDLNGYDVIFFFSYEGSIDERVSELRMALDIAKKGGADRITVFAPYTPYCRGDKRDQHHSSAAMKVFADSCINLYGACYITCELHNPATLELFDGPRHNLSLRELMMAEVRKGSEIMVTVSADAGGVKNARKWAETLYLEDGRRLEKVVVDKMRTGNDSSAMAEECYGADVCGKVVLIVDDEAMTVGTLVSAAKVLKEAGAAEVCAMTYHGILAGPALERLANSVLSELLVANTVPISEQKIEQSGGKLRVKDISGDAIETVRMWYDRRSLRDKIDYAYGKAG